MANLIEKIQVITCWFLVYLYNVNTYSVFTFLPRVWGKSLLASSSSPSPSFSFQTYSHFPCSCTSSHAATGQSSSQAGQRFSKKKYRNMMKWKRRNIASAITTKTITEITHITCKPHSIDLLIFNAFLHINERKKHYIT